jgi:hypothetical protein
LNKLTRYSFSFRTGQQTELIVIGSFYFEVASSKNEMQSLTVHASTDESVFEGQNLAHHGDKVLCTELKIQKL